VFGDPRPVRLEPPIQEPATLTHPPVTLMPFAKVEVAVVEAAYMVSACTPPEKLEVERSPLMVVVAVVPTESELAPRLATAKLVKVEVELLPRTLRKPWKVEVPVVFPCMVVVAVPPTQILV